MIRQLAAVTFLLAWASLCSTTHADEFDNEADWLASLCPDSTVVAEPLDIEIDPFSNGIAIPNPHTTTFGGIELNELDLISVFALRGIGGEAALGIPSSGATLNFDGSLGMINGVSFCYIGNEWAIDITYLDGTTETVLCPETPNFDQNTPSIFHAWTNTSGVDVASIALRPTTENGAIFLTGTDVAFCNADAPETCQSMLQDTIDALNAKLPLASASDQVWIAEAIYELECSQNPLFFQTENRLSDLGCYFFNHNFYATYFLECVAEDALVEDCLIGIQDVLGCVVDAEIEYALANPDANSNLILYSEYFEDYAEQFADAELYLEAVLLHFYAWLFASNA